MKVYIVMSECVANYTNAIIYGGVQAIYTNEALAEQHISMLPNWDNNMDEAISNYLIVQEIVEVIDLEKIAAIHRANPEQETPQPEDEEYYEVSEDICSGCGYTTANCLC